MLNAESAEYAEISYWRIDNHAVVQGQLFEAAEFVVTKLMSRICADRYSEFGLASALDLLVEIAYGESDFTEVELGFCDWGERCRNRIRERWGCIAALLNLEIIETSNRVSVLLGVLDLFDRLETKTCERERFLAAISGADWPNRALDRLQELRLECSQ